MNSKTSQPYRDELKEQPKALIKVRKPVWGPGIIMIIASMFCSYILYTSITDLPADANFSVYSGLVYLFGICVGLMAQGYWFLSRYIIKQLNQEENKE